MSSVLPLDAFRQRFAALRETANRTNQSFAFRQSLLSAGRFRVEWPEGDAVMYAISPNEPRLSSPGVRAWLEHGGRITLDPGGREIHLRDGRRRREPCGQLPVSVGPLIDLVLGAPR